MTRYAVDGVHLDYARYPTERFDYSRSAVRAFRDAFGAQLSAAVRRQLDAREAEDPLVYPDSYPDEWKAFRIARLTALVGRLRTTVKTARPARSSPWRRRRTSRRPAITGCRIGPRGSRRASSTPCARWPTRQDSQRFAEQIAARAQRQGRTDGLGRHRRLSHPAGAERSTTSRPPAASAPPASSSSPTTA